MITVRLFQKTERVRTDGKAPIYFVFTEGSKRRYIATGHKVPIALFDNEKGIVKRGADNSIKLNTWFKKELSKIEDIILEKMNEGKVVTFELVEQLYRSNGKLDFITFAEEELHRERGSLSPNTFKQYTTALNNLREFRPVVPFSHINLTFLQDYRYYLTSVKVKANYKSEATKVIGKSVNGMYYDFATIRKYWKIGVEKGFGKGDPFKSFKFKIEDGDREWLDKNELLRLDELLLSDKIASSVKNSLKHFLFSCYTGIRFGDKLKLNKLDIQDNRLMMRLEKTDAKVIIPLNSRALKLLDDVLARPMKRMNKRVNKDLDTAMQAAGIKKRITFHCSRHSFAIHSLLLGIDIITVRDWLGHTSIKTTEIYLKVAQKYKDQSMLKWENF